jgi:heme A synthase
LLKIVSVVPLVLLSGFFVAGISGGKSCNTYPMVGEHYFWSKKHLNADIPLWQNFSENKLVTQVNHRTLATLVTLYGTYSVSRFLGLGLTK